MPAPASLAFLPKPVLFGLYGAIGGLLGALVFGEPAWQLFPPPPAVKPQPQVAIATPTDVELIAGKPNTFGVKIDRADFDAPVQVKVENLPAGVQADAIIIDKGKKEGAVRLQADEGAAAGTTTLKVTAEATAADKPPSASTNIKLEVRGPNRPQADVVFVLDVTGSMDWAIDGIRDGVRNFATQLEAKKIDFRIGLVAFRDLTNPADERAGLLLMQVLDFGGSKFTKDVERFKAQVAALRATGGGDIPESSLEAVVKASDLEFRPGATKVLLLITDAPPKVKLQQNEFQTNAEEKAAVAKTAEYVREKGIDAVHLVVRSADPRDGTNDKETYRALMEVGTGKGGQFFDLHDTVTRGAAGFTSLIDRFTSAVVEAAAAKNPTNPTAAGQAGAPVLTTASLQSTRQYAEGSEGRLLVLSAVWTGAIAAIVCLILLSGQHHYLRGAMPPAASIIAGLVGGGLVGLLGGACGYGLFLLSPQGAVFDAIFRVFGWAILGGLAGTGLSLFIPNLKWVHGLVGGAIGGAAGAVGFMAVNAVVGKAIGGNAADVVGRLAGGLILGACIGLMVALVEAAFRRAWLEVRYGSRETITVNLGPEPVKIGGDNRTCTVWARGAAPVALRYFIRGGQVFCEDAPNRKEMVVGNGDVRELGHVTVTVRTGSESFVAAEVSTKRTVIPPPPKTPPGVVLDLPEEETTLPVKPHTIVETGVLRALPVEDETLPIQATPAPRSSMPASPPRPPVPSATAAVRPPAPPAPPAPSAAKLPAPPPAPPAAKPVAAKPAAGPRDPDACPSCGRKNPGRPGTRYCMLCDQTY